MNTGDCLTLLAAILGLSICFDTVWITSELRKKSKACTKGVVDFKLFLYPDLSHCILEKQRALNPFTRCRHSLQMDLPFCSICLEKWPCPNSSLSTCHHSTYVSGLILPFFSWWTCQPLQNGSLYHSSPGGNPTLLQSPPWSNTQIRVWSWFSTLLPHSGILQL